MRQAIGLYPCYEGYGLTETGPVLTSTLVGGVSPRPASVGPAAARRRDPPGRHRRPCHWIWTRTSRATGLVAARGANLFSGYWPDGAHGPDDDGWFRTGDVGYLDADGDLHLVDRANDLIIVNGFNVYPHEVERVLGELDEVAEVGRGRRAGRAHRRVA